jgi:hypothetical protein
VVRLKPILKLDSLNSGFAADVSYVSSADPEKLDSLNSGFAARCEARLCLAAAS